jgi:very-short-patch-repair endonuclease
MPETYSARLEKAWSRLPSDAVFSGRTAAWLHGLDVDLGERIEVTVPKALGITTRSGMIVRRCALDRREVVKRRGLPVTSGLRTLLDVSCRLYLTEAVVIADMALHARLVRLDALVAALDMYDGAWGIKALRRVARHAEPATESPMETRLRMLLVLAGLPRPLAQVPIHDSAGRFLGRPDLYYPEVRLGLEYDGGVHRSSLVEDNRRQNRLVDSGVRLLRFTAGDIYKTPGSVLALVRSHVHESVPTTAYRTGFEHGSVHTSAGRGST